MKRNSMILTVAVMFIVSAHGQGFLNLDFESAYNLPGNPGPYGMSVSITNALPDWTAWNGPAGESSALSSIYYVSNFISGSQTSVELLGGSLALGGNLSVELFANSAISQTGILPANAQSLQFEAYGLPSPFSVTLGGQTLSCSTVSVGSDYNVYGANIPSAMDGQLEELTFSCFGVGSGLVVLDDIDFSPISVPEPPEYALIGLGAILFGLYRWRKQQRSLVLNRC